MLFDYSAPKPALPSFLFSLKTVLPFVSPFSFPPLFFFCCPFEEGHFLFSQGDPGIDNFIQGPKGEKGRRGHQVRWLQFHAEMTTCFFRTLDTLAESPLAESP